MLKKAIKKFKITTYVERYFEINFEWAEIYVKNDPLATLNPVGWQNEKKNKIKVIPFRSVLRCFNEQTTNPVKNWKFGFHLITVEKNYLLYAQT